MTAALRVRAPDDESRYDSTSLDFELPDALAAHEPPEARGLERDGVRLLVTDPDDDSVVHSTVRNLPDFLRAGDVLVVNTSATINAALDAWRPGSSAVPDEMIAVHLSSPVRRADDARPWIIELRRLAPEGTRPLLNAHAGERIRLRGGGSVTLVQPFGADIARGLPNGGVRLWEADLDCKHGVMAYADRFGFPIRYGYVRERWPLSAYQTVFATEPGSAEMPSAGRPFTADLVRRCIARGVAIAPILLHTGVASVEAGEPPYPERYEVPSATAAAVNHAKASGGRTIAVGTTAVRAIETVAAPNGTVGAGWGWTDLVITPERGVRTVDALLTGFHEPRASHLAMLEAIAGGHHLSFAYRTALDARYLWHEFGDLHLIVRRSQHAHDGRLERTLISTPLPGTRGER